MKLKLLIYILICLTISACGSNENNTSDEEFQVETVELELAQTSNVLSGSSFNEDTIFGIEWHYEFIVPLSCVEGDYNADDAWDGNLGSRLGYKVLVNNIEVEYEDFMLFTNDNGDLLYFKVWLPKNKLDNAIDATYTELFNSPGAFNDLALKPEVFVTK